MPYRVVITAYRYAHSAEEAYKFALAERGEGKRTEIITEEQYKTIILNSPNIQDLLEWRRKNILGLTR